MIIKAKHDFKQIAQDDYKEWLVFNKKKIPEDLYNYIKDSSRVNKFLDNLTKELINLDKRLKNVKRQTLKEACYSMTEWFVHLSKKHLDEQRMSEAMKKHLSHEQEKQTFEYKKKQLKEEGILIEETSQESRH